MRPAGRPFVVALLLATTSCGLGGDPPSGADPLPNSTATAAREDPFRTTTDLECETELTSVLVVDQVMDVVGQPTPQTAARAQLDAVGIDRTQLTERVRPAAASSTSVDYLTDDDRLVVYVDTAPGAQDTWLATHVTSCGSVPSRSSG